MRTLSIKTNFHERLWGWIYLGIQILILPTVLYICNQFFGLELSDAEINFAFFAVNFIVITVIFHRYLLANGAIALSKPAIIIITGIGGYFLYVFSSNIIATLIHSLYPSFYNVNDSFISTMVSDEFRLMFVGTVILVPVVEETLYRGLIFGSLYNRSRVLAYIISTLSFAVLHVYGYIGTYSPVHLLLCLVEYIPAGISLGWAYAKTDSIWTPILIHMAVNAIAVSAMR